MINILALGLLFTSLVTAGFFSPPAPENQDVIVKEGRRAVLVEYEKDDGNTKVFISPQQETAHQVVDEMPEAAKDKVKEAASASFNPRELVCDAYGKCKHKIASAIGKTEETAYKAAEKAKDTVKDTASGVTERVGEVKDGAKEKVEMAKGKVREAVDDTKKLRDDVMSEGRRKMEGTKEKVHEKAREAGEMVEDATGKVKESASKVKREGQKELSEIMRHGREVVSDVFGYLVSWERVAQFTGILHLMGFSAAYGMGLWITFASSYVLASALPRHQFALVQSKIYPVYFKAMAYAIGLALLGHLMGLGRSSRVGGGGFQGLNLLTALGMVLVNLWYLEPRATKVLFDRMKLEKEEGRGNATHTTTTTQTTETTAAGTRNVDSFVEVAGRGLTGGIASKEKEKEKLEEAAAKSEIFRLSETLKRLNSYSSFLNVLTLMSLTWHLTHLGQNTHMVCSA